LAENPMVHALSCQWPFGESKLDLKQSSLRRARSNNLKLASWRAELVVVLTQQVELENRNGRLDAAATPPAETSSVSGATTSVWKEESSVLM
jgi:hypothetical protein